MKHPSLWNIFTCGRQFTHERQILFSQLEEATFQSILSKARILTPPDSWHFEVHLGQRLANEGPQAKRSLPPCFCTACELRLIFAFLNGRKKKSNDEQHSMTHENCRKFKFQCPSVMFFFFRMQACLFIYVLSVAAWGGVQQKNWVVATETIWPKSLKYSLPDP